MNDNSQLSRSGRGTTRLMVAFVVATVTTGSIYYRVQAQEGSPRYQPRKAAVTPISPQTAERLSKSGGVYVRKPDGSVLMTNNPEKYAHRRGYTIIDPAQARAPRRTVPATMPKPRPSTASARATAGIAPEIISNVRYYAGLHGLDEALVFAVIKQESAFKITARSPKGAEGLMQLMPGTAAQLGVRDTFNASENIRGGTTYLARLLRRFNGDLQLALAGYNAGPEKVKEYGGIPPYDETRTFVRNVLKYRNDFVRSPVQQAVARGPAPKPTVASLRSQDDYVVHFMSGHEQRAENVLDDGDHFIIQYLGRSFRVKKSQIREVTRGA